MISRVIEDRVFGSLVRQKVVGLFGARRTGKTFLMNQIAARLEGYKVLKLLGEDLDTAEILSSQRLSLLQTLVAGYDYLLIDEAQAIPSIGINLKLLVDNVPDLAIFITGSAALDLRNKVGEPLTGRSKFFHLYPFSHAELGEDFMTYRRNIESRLVFGTYPQVHLAGSEGEKRDVLMSIRDGALLKDILALDNLKGSLFILQLLRVLSFQIGNDVSHTELANLLGVSKNTVARYLDLLEKAYVIFSLQGFSRNLRKEIAKSKRYYFWDNGVRNSVISNFNRLALRDDVGRLWENFCMSERMKFNAYQERDVACYFWRTYDQKEIDLVEEREGKLFAFEMKWKDEKGRAPKDFRLAYPDAGYEVVSRDNFPGGI
jgi:uncharacterized protein